MSDVDGGITLLEAADVDGGITILGAAAAPGLNLRDVSWAVWEFGATRRSVADHFSGSQTLETKPAATIKATNAQAAIAFAPHRPALCCRAGTHLSLTRTRAGTSEAICSAIASSMRKRARANSSPARSCEPYTARK